MCGCPFFLHLWFISFYRFFIVIFERVHLFILWQTNSILFPLGDSIFVAFSSLSLSFPHPFIIYFGFDFISGNLITHPHWCGTLILFYRKVLFLFFGLLFFLLLLALSPLSPQSSLLAIIIICWSIIKISFVIILHVHWEKRIWKYESKYNYRFFSLIDLKVNAMKMTKKREN